MKVQGLSGLPTALWLPQREFDKGTSAHPVGSNKENIPFS
jgi:hypothetical protein